MQRKFGENAYWVYELLRYVILISPAFLFALQSNICYPRRGIDRTEGDVHSETIVAHAHDLAKSKRNPFRISRC
jgi:hypothetical protein